MAITFESWTMSIVPALLLYLPLSYLIFSCIRAVYNITLHPLAKFPGPKIAAMTRMYEFYWEVFRGGLYSEKIAEMHKQYGPIVRVNPKQLHINDPAFYDQLYNFSRHIDRPKTSFDNLQETPSFEAHRVRRKVLGGYFTKSAVLQFEDVVQDNVDVLCKSLVKLRHTGKTVKLTTYFRCLTSEIILEYAFAERYGFLGDLEKSEVFFASQNTIFRQVYLLRFYKLAWFCFGIAAMLPEWVPGNRIFDASMLSFMKDIEQRVQRQKKKKNKEKVAGGGNSGHYVLMEEYARHPDLPAKDQTDDRLVDTAMLLVSAGFETTAYTLETAFYHLLSNQKMMERLRNEIQAAFPEMHYDQDEPLPWSQLEKLPYLAAVVQESLRLSLGVMAPLPRINSQADMFYGGYTIPKGTGVGMSQRDIHYNPEIYPEPKKFDPERWLQGQKSEELQKFWMPFSRGARVCLGRELAYSELFITIATIIRRGLQFKLFETTFKDVDPKYDYFVPKPETDHGVRVTVE